MKIKEVIQQTGLTDRAVRLYIDNGLLNPSITESYSGRKSIDFTEGDVRQLNNVAMLRKAGFSITDIKSIIENNETKNIIQKHIDTMQKEINDKAEIIEKLRSIPLDRDVTIDEICASLSSTVEENEIPAEDIKLTVKEILKKIVSIALAGLVLIFSVVFLVENFIISFDYRYLCYNPQDLVTLLVQACWLIPIALSATIIIKSTGRRFIKNSTGKRKRRTALLIAFSLASFMLQLPASFLFSFFIPPFYSQTTDIENYLKFDEYVEAELNYNYSYLPLYDVFPRRVPTSASHNSDTTKYLYRLMPCPTCNGTVDVYAEWALPSAEYEAAKKCLPRYDVGLEEYIIEISGLDDTTEEEKEYLISSAKEHSEYKTEDNGDWTITFYIKEEGKMDHSYLIAAYNDKEQKMRYIASFCCAHHSSDTEPFYLSLEW